jgi:hypothetical protein
MGLEARRREPGERAGDRARDGQQHVTGRAGLEDRLHHRLQQRAHAGAGFEIIPALERVVIGKQEVACRRGLVEEGRGGNLEGHLRQRLRELRRLGQRVNRIRLVDDQHLDLAGVHRLLQGLETGVSVAVIEPGSEVDRLPDVAGDVIEDAHRGAELHRSAVLGADPAGDGEAGLRAGELARQRVTASAVMPVAWAARSAVWAASVRGARWRRRGRWSAPRESRWPSRARAPSRCPAPPRAIRRR